MSKTQKFDVSSQNHPPPIPEDEVQESVAVKGLQRLWSWLDMNLVAGELDLLIFSTCLKLLLFPSYRSTDFEVHRNWLAITSSLPISRWYYDTTSEWTLDYPPFFAYFEKLLSIPAAFVDPAIVGLRNLHYSAWSVVVYQRSTVIFTELVLGVVLQRFIQRTIDPSKQRIISALLFLHPGFLIVDHIHFQYNGFMFGILLWSILMARDGNKLTSGLLFAILLNFKHIYMYLAPAYFIYLLRSFCMSTSGAFLPYQFISLANTVIAVFVLSLGPFLVMGQIPQLLSRLFPFTRGLNHAYWAPNAWALYTVADRILLRYVKRAGINLVVNESGVVSTSRGLVGDTVFAVLPGIQPSHTFLITIVFQSIFLVKLWRAPTYKSFVTALTLCGYTSFMFGWHVHEKAILLVLVPLSLLAAENHAYFRTCLLASAAGVYSLFPLLFTPAEAPTKIIYSILWGVCAFAPLNRQVYEFPSSLPWVVLDILEKFYLAGFGLLQIFVTVFPYLARLNVGSKITPCVPSDEVSCPAVDARLETLEFLPLMLTSVYCAVGLVWAYLRLTVIYLRHEY